MQADWSAAASWQQWRRRLIAATAGLPALAHAQASAPALPASAPRTEPRDVGRKFNADGTPMPFEGNTFLGHFTQQGNGYEVFDAWLDIVREMPRHAFARRLTLTPTSSWHVTLVGGVNDADRHTAAWPSDMSRDMPMAEVNRILLQRLERRRATPLAPCRFVIDDRRPPSARREGSMGIPLRPADADTATRLRAARDELADLMRLRRPDHDDYGYHVTIGYLYRFLDPAESAAMQAATADWMRRLAARGPLVIEGFHFCVLRDMFAYREIRTV